MKGIILAGGSGTRLYPLTEDTPRFEHLLGDGHQFGISLSYAVQPSPDGLAQAFIIGADFIGGDHVAMILGDNIFAGHGLKKRLLRAANKQEGATVFGYYVDDPERFGIVTARPFPLRKSRQSQSPTTVSPDFIFTTTRW